MTRFQALLIALSVAFAVVAGTYAAIRTTSLGAAASPQVSAVAIERRQHALDQTAAALRRALQQRPPKLPPVQAPPSPAPRVVVVRSAAATVAAAPVAAPATTTARAHTSTHSSPTTGGEHDGHDSGESADD